MDNSTCGELMALLDYVENFVINDKKMSYSWIDYISLVSCFASVVASESTNESK